MRSRKSTCTEIWLIPASAVSFRRPDSSCDLNEDDEDRLVIADEDEDTSSTVVKRDPLNLKENVLNFKTDKPRKKHLRFNGMPEEEVAKKLLPDLISEDLDILIVRICPISCILIESCRVRVYQTIDFIFRLGSIPVYMRLSKATTMPVQEIISVSIDLHSSA